MFRTKVVEKIKTLILCSGTFFFRRILPFMRKFGKKKCGKAREASDDNTTHALCVLVN
jgi:hypothetical protein